VVITFSVSTRTEYHHQNHYPLKAAQPARVAAAAQAEVGTAVAALAVQVVPVAETGNHLAEVAVGLAAAAAVGEAGDVDNQLAGVIVEVVAAATDKPLAAAVVGQVAETDNHPVAAAVLVAAQYRSDLAALRIHPE